MKVKLIISILILLCLTIIFSCRHSVGERTIYGVIPLEEETIKTEQICRLLSVPNQSNFLECQIDSKRDSGVVTNIYSTELNCSDISAFYTKELQSKNWKLIESEKKNSFLSGTDFYDSFQSGIYGIGITCSDMRDFRGVRRYYVSCRWKRDYENK